ncbi:hypothetical protein A3460_02600 [Enterobacter roggenkampii]|uniref:Imm52 family immunity protein n=1 Tax=Enterobacter roggenkampii TaxID=1812935 RepID=UPI0007B3AAD9|nr:Imm52 family immunity protein [Enterobacter roggenkampii]KZP73763.1 hypothetical protein A3460_02600 [Enterobacter roggenkampii]
MNIELSINLDYRIDADDIEFDDIVGHFNYLSSEFGSLLSIRPDWYETGYSRKQALEHVAFNKNGITEDTYQKWLKRYVKDAPLFVESVWDGKDDDCSSGISYRKMFFDEKNRVVVNSELNIPSNELTVSKIFDSITNIANEFKCSHISLETNGYTLHGRNVFPDRLSSGWMLYIPHVVLPELIPEAARVIPVMDGNKQKGTIVVSTEKIFDGNNKEHIGKANDIEIKLLDLGFLPLITEL